MAHRLLRHPGLAHDLFRKASAPRGGSSPAPPAVPVAGTKYPRTLAGQPERLTARTGHRHLLGRPPPPGTQQFVHSWKPHDPSHPGPGLLCRRGRGQAGPTPVPCAGSSSQHWTGNEGPDFGRITSPMWPGFAPLEMSVSSGSGDSDLLGPCRPLLPLRARQQDQAGERVTLLAPPRGSASRDPAGPRRTPRPARRPGAEVGGGGAGLPGFPPSARQSRP